MTSSRGRGTVVIAALAALVALFGLLLFLRTPADDRADVVDDAPVVTMKPTQRLSTLWVGDDFTAGAGGAARNAYPYILCSARGWNCNVDAQSGTGFVSDGREDSSTNSALIDRIDLDAKRYEVDLLIVDAGRADFDQSAATVEEALSAYLAKAKQVWPSARVAVIVPTYMTAAPAAEYSALEPVVRSAAQEFGAAVIDPVQDGWYNGVDIPSMLVPGGNFLNAPGNQLVAEQIGKSLDKAGLSELGAAN